jgi:hypothetical protein
LGPIGPWRDLPTLADRNCHTVEAIATPPLYPLIENILSENPDRADHGASVLAALRKLKTPMRIGT